MRRTEKLRSVFIALTFIFLCGQIYSIVVKADFWKSVSEQTRESVLSDGSERPSVLSECISDGNAGISDDTGSTVFIPSLVQHIPVNLPQKYELVSISFFPELTVITKYLRSIIAIQTVK